MGWKLKVATCSFTAELWGILKALETLYNLDAPEIYIATDSLAAILVLKNQETNKDQVLTEITNIIDNFTSAGTKVTLIWIPSHLGI